MIEVTPLAQAIEMVRSIWFGQFDLGLAVNVLYFVAFSVIGAALTTRRLTALFLR
ncbi:MAG: hypothetical protein O2815_06495 [Actinomycetota bacterium]|nr:hypothetical protein [Actinomycetota bacterium]